MRLFRDRRGNMAMMAGLLALPLLGMVGLAIDFGNATAVKAQLDLAADAAALLATTAASNAYLAGVAEPIATAQVVAVQRFTAQARTQAGVSIDTVTVAVHQSGTQFSAEVNYKGIVKTTLGQLFGVLNMGVAGKASSSLSINPYIDISVLMDVSSSMLIAAGPAEMKAMEELTARAGGGRCAFACHSNPSGSDYYTLAVDNKVQLRIDVLREAVRNLIANLAALNTHAAFRLGLYTFAKALDPMYPLSSQIKDASAVLPRIAPYVNLCRGEDECPDTYFAAAMDNFGLNAGVSGNGAAPATSQKFLFIVSDGVTDDWAPGRGRSVTTVTKPSCDAIKARGITVLTLYTPYLPLQNNYAYDHFVAPIQTRIGPEMQACASSPTMYFKAENASEIDTKLKLMLAAVLKTSGHLTQ